MPFDSIKKTAFKQNKTYGSPRLWNKSERGGKETQLKQRVPQAQECTLLYHH